MTDEQKDDARAAWAGMVAATAQTALALAQMTRTAADFRRTTKQSGLDLQPPIPDVLGAGFINSTINRFLRTCIEQGIVSAEDEGLQYTNLKG